MGRKQKLYKYKGVYYTSDEIKRAKNIMIDNDTRRVRKIRKRGPK